MAHRCPCKIFVFLPMKNGRSCQNLPPAIELTTMTDILITIFRMLLLGSQKFFLVEKNNGHHCKLSVPPTKKCRRYPYKLRLTYKTYTYSTYISVAISPVCIGMSWRIGFEIMVLFNIYICCFITYCRFSWNLEG